MKAVGIILAGGNNNRMGELSRKRAIPAMPVGGSFRCIDFVLSNMSNSHVQTVAVLTQYNSRSLNEHREVCICLHQPLRQKTVTGIVARQMPCIRILIS